MHQGKNIHIAAAIATTALLTQLPVLAEDPWQTDIFQPLPDFTTYGGDIGTDASGHFVFSVGSATIDADGNRTALVRARDSAGNWNTLDTATVPAEQDWPVVHFTAFASGSTLEVPGLYAAGSVFNGSGYNQAWIVNESHDGGSTWDTDMFQPVGANNAACVDIKVSPSGDVYAAGTTAAITTDGVISNPSWVVRKRLAGASAFVTVDTIASTSSQLGVRAIGFHPTAGVFVVGYLPGGRHLLPVWTVRRSSNNGLSWTTVDSFMDNNWLYSWGWDIVVGGSGTIYVSGSAMNFKTGQVTWVVRRSRDGGTSWDVVDSFVYGTATRAQGLTLDATENIIVCGYAQTSNEGDHWLVRKGTVGTTYVKQGKKTVEVSTVSWSPIDDYQYVPGSSAHAVDVTCDALGSIFVTGSAADQSGVDRWTIRKLAAP